MTARTALAFTMTLLLVAPAIAAGDNWTLAFTNNGQLPPVFREFTVARPDGSTMRAYLSRYGDPADDRRPLMVYFDGSGAGSLFVKVGDRVGTSLFGVLARAAGESYHVVSAEKRGVPFLQSARGSGEIGSVEYAQHATYEGRLAEGRLLLDAMLKQPLVDASRVVIVGHSEGADVAAALAAADPRVTHLAFLAGGGPSQMFDLMVLARKRMQKQGANAEEIEAAVEKLEEDYRAIFADPSSTTKFFQGHAYRRWSSFFQHPPAENLLASPAKLYVGHGSADESGPIESFDYLVAELIRAGRKDVTIRRCPGCDHGFSPAGQPRKGPPMDDIFREILNWANE